MPEQNNSKSVHQNHPRGKKESFEINQNGYTPPKTRYPQPPPDPRKESQTQD